MIKFARDETRWMQFAGGLVTSGPPQFRREGTLAAALNYEPALEGGYRRTKGYERFDGRPSPSAATYRIVEINWTTPPVIGGTVAVGTAVATVASVTGSMTVLADPSGDIATGAIVVVAGLPVGIVTNALPSGGVTLENDAVYAGMAADLRRTSISAVPGSGPLRGIASLADQIYAWRDSADGLSGVMYRATTAGWAAVSFGEEIAFSNANTSVEVGDVLTRAGVTATIMAVVVETGSLASGVNTGRLILSGRAGGPYTAGAATSTGGGTLTLGGAQTAIALPPGGFYRAIVHNFSGAAGADRLYFVNGVGRAHEYDGTTLVPINTGDANDKPAHVLQHAQRLILAIDGSLMWSVAGKPVIFDGISGSQEFAVGAVITGLASMTGKAMAIFTDRGGQYLEGTPSSAMELSTLQDEEGALPGAAIYAGDLFALSTTGLLSFRASQAYGGFEANDVGKAFQDYATAVAARFSCAARVDIPGSENQIRFMASDGSGLVCLIVGAKVAAATPIKYPVQPTCMWSGVVAGSQRAFFGDSSGFVYEILELPSFDGQEIESFFKTNPASLKSPFVDKTFFDGFAEAACTRFSRLSCSFEFSSGSPSLRNTVPTAFELFGAGGSWDIAAWDSFAWDAAAESMPKINIKGSGHNISLTFYSRSRYDYGHTLHSMAMRVALRKTTRTS